MRDDTMLLLQARETQADPGQAARQAGERRILPRMMHPVGVLAQIVSTSSISS